MKIFAFKLTMPNTASWDGRWSGESDLHVKFRTLTDKQIEESGIIEGDHYYDFGDGWGANVNVSVVSSKTKQDLIKISRGFAGYEWMIGSIIKHGAIISPSEQPQAN